jgi:hypothetical protein
MRDDTGAGLAGVPRETSTMILVPHRPVLRSLLVTTGLGAALACGSSTTPLPTAASLDLVPGADGQSAPAGARLPAPLAVIAHATDGTTVPRAKVRWQVTVGSGAVLSDSVTLSDGNGRAEVALTLGPGAGTYKVDATPTDAPSATVSFTATATAPPSLTSVTPSNFTAGDTIVIAGTALAADAAVEVAGALALVLDGSPTSVTAVAPPCLAPGSVSVRVRVAGALSNALSATYASSLAPLVLQVGEYAALDPAQLAGCATFPAATTDTVEYLVAPQSATGVPGVSAGFRIRGDSVVVVAQALPAVRTELPFAERFHDALREQEAAAARLPRPALLRAQLTAATAPTVKVGDRRTFQVCDSLPCSTSTQFASVSAHAQYVGQHAAIFVDDAAPAGGFTSTDIASIGVLFDEDLYGVDTQAFGAESDVDQNGVTIVLFSPQVNKLTPKSQCGTSIITGYFFGIDIDPAFRTDSRSNKGEVFYALAPDPNGTISCSLSTDLVRRLVPVTFIHEFQHMISYGQHVLQRNGDSEVLWLNEGLSHIAEELGALHFEAKGQDTLFSRFAIGDLYNASLYLTNPDAVYVLPISGTGSLEERGAAWLFLRWLLDQYGPATTRRLLETSQVGATNVAAAAGVSFDRLLTQWFLANWVSDLPGFTAPAPLKYTTWRFRTTYAGLNQSLPSRFPTPFPLQPQLFAPGFQFSGTLRSGSGDYMRVRQAPGAKGFALLLTDQSGAPLPASIAARLNVIRLR